MNHTTNTSCQRIGILGDGQLARMLALAAYDYGLRPVLLTEDANSSAGQVCPLQVRGSFKSKTDVHTLLSQVDVAIIESEFINCDVIEATGLADRVYPNIAALRLLQNKLEQKRLLMRLNIPTSKLFEQDRLKSDWIEELLTKERGQVVLKFATLGYDGKGVCILDGQDSDRKKMEDFLNEASSRRIDVFAESKIAFLNEYAMVGVRSINGDFIHYPLVETHQRNGVCRHIVGPATAFGAQSSLEVASAKICKKIAEELKIVGTFAIEFFLDPAGQLLVNEIAPRVHNTGHFTQNIFATSQFENHIQAVLGSRLIQPETPNFFAMYNFLGPDGVFGTVSAPIPKVHSNGHSNVHLHWYGKSGISPRRKLGHINFSSNDLTKREEALLHMEQIIKNWEDETRKVIPPYNMEIRL